MKVVVSAFRPADEARLAWLRQRHLSGHGVGFLRLPLHLDWEAKPVTLRSARRALESWFPRIGEEFGLDGRAMLRLVGADRERWLSSNPATDRAGQIYEMLINVRRWADGAPEGSRLRASRMMVFATPDTASLQASLLPPWTYMSWNGADYLADNVDRGLFEVRRWLWSVMKAEKIDYFYLEADCTA